MQKRKSGGNLRSITGREVNGFIPGNKVLSPEEMQKHQQDKAVGEEMQMQANFFTLRAQLFNTIVRNQPLFSAGDIEGAHALAHEAAKVDLLARVKGAKELLERLGQKFVYPDTALWLEGKSIDTHEPLPVPE